MDGLTTNGVLVMHPAGDFVSEPAPGVWREISVCGNVLALRETRSAQQRGKLVKNTPPMVSLVDPVDPVDLISVEMFVNIGSCYIILFPILFPYFS